MCEWLRPSRQRRSSSTRTRSTARSSASPTRSSSATPTSTEVALVGIHTRGVPLAQRLRRLIAEFTGAEVALGTLDITFYRDDVYVRGGEAPLHPQPVVRRRASTSRSRGRPASSSTTSSTRAGRSAPRSRRSSPTAGPRASSSPASSTAATASCPIRPDYVGKNLPTARGERIQVQLVEVDEVDAVLLDVPSTEREVTMADVRPADPRRAPAARSRPPRRHLISIADLDARGRRAPARARRHLRALARPRREEAPDAARAHGREPLLRVLDAHVVELRARREAALGRRHVDQGDRLGGRQGRVAEGHGAHDRLLRPGRRRHPPPGDRRAAPRRAPHGARTS